MRPVPLSMERAAMKPQAEGCGPAAEVIRGSEKCPGGTFRLEMAIPDGRQIYHIQAVTADGLQRRSITMKFYRRTPLDDGKGRVEEIPD